ncbi:TetR/AcrR family transcriptional regulator [Mycobacterium palustre]|uniref:TetR/AcrR family transcriptional regulator n=1 Tax=Mycobacterium palustre TaxID=153971 RepID=UPI002481A9C3|nr:TetR/AcrR family transcriptional regulator [Mycobacterium palustre]
MDRGYDGMTVDHVARLAGVGRATLYRRWPTKTAMVIDALKRSQVAVLEDPDSGDPQADFEVLLRVLYAAIEREHPIIRALEIETHRHPDLGVALQRDFVAQRKDVLIGVLRRAAADGLLRAPSDLELLARVGPALIWEQFALSAEGPWDSDLLRRISDLIFVDRVPSRAGINEHDRAADVGSNDATYSVAHELGSA